MGDGNDLAAIAAALEAARAETTRPTVVILRTYIADPAPTKRNTSEAHGAPLGAEEVRRTKEIMGWPEEPRFFVPEDALDHWREAVDRGAASRPSGVPGSPPTQPGMPRPRASCSSGCRGHCPTGGTRDCR